MGWLKEKVEDGIVLFARGLDSRFRGNDTVGRSAASSFLIILCAIFLVISFSGYAEVITYNSSIVWRLDDKGDYILPQYSSNEIQECKEIIETKGDIEIITANWKFKGQVSLEVSANKGVNYSSVINGVPFTVPSNARGDQFKWRITLGDDSEVSEVKIFCKDESSLMYSFGQPALSGFNFRKAVYINSLCEEQLFNYQIQVVVAESSGAKDYDVECGSETLLGFRDVRFTAADGQTLLSYYLESVTGEAPNRLAHFWVKIPQIPSGENLLSYIYYGCSESANLSSPKNVFDFFDEFDGNQVNLKEWNIKLLLDDGVCKVDDSKLYLNNANLFSKNYQIKDGVMEYKAKIENGLAGLSSNESLAIVKGDKIEGQYSGEGSSPEPLAAGISYDYRLLIKDANVTVQRYADNFKTLKAELTCDSEEDAVSGCLGFEAGNSTVSFDWVRVRRYAGDVVKVDRDAVAKESAQEVSLARFEDMAIADNGNLVLSGNVFKGVYACEFLPLPYKARILIPSWEGQLFDDKNVKLDVSLNGGSSYVENCEKDSFYYASEGDFSEGDNLQFNLKIEFASLTDKKNIEIEKINVDYRPGTITVVFPNGGEILKADRGQELMWSALEYEETYPLRLEYSKDSGRRYEAIMKETENDGSFLWKVPDIEISTARIKVCDGNNSDICDTSDSSFLISKEGSKIITPIEETIGWDDIGDVSGLMSDSSKDVVIDTDATVVVDGEILFKTLIIGDGKGSHASKLILRGKINPRSGDIIIRRGGELVQESKHLQRIGGDLTIEAGGILTHGVNTEDELYQINFSAASVTVEPGGVVAAKGKGYSGGMIRGAGKGKAGGKYISKAASGGSHGGKGGGTLESGLVLDDSYGSPRAPQDIGSGGAGSWFSYGGAGGGLIRLNAQGFFSISGEICADGADGSISPNNQFDGGGGAGGSIYLSAGEFGGHDGCITATGGSGHVSGGGGGGGRIYIKAPAGVIRGTMNVNGGSGFKHGHGGSMIVE
jgi:hypothetical protein